MTTILPHKHCFSKAAKGSDQQIHDNGEETILAPLTEEARQLVAEGTIKEAVEARLGM